MSTSQLENSTPCSETTPTTGHGGARRNAGRKARFKEDTMVMRIPLSKVDAIRAWLQPPLQAQPDDDHQANLELQPIQFRRQLQLPYPLESVAAGFPSPAQDDIEKNIDLNEHLVANPTATFVLRVNSLSMKNAGIEVGDPILIDRSLNPEHGDIVLALIHNEFTVKRFMREKQNHQPDLIWLKAENPDYPDIHLHSDEQLQIWGVVTCILKKLK